MYFCHLNTTFMNIYIYSLKTIRLRLGLSLKKTRIQKCYLYVFRKWISSQYIGQQAQIFVYKHQI